MPDEFIRTAAQLDALVGPIAEASVRKEIGFLHPVYRRWIESSPFAVAATSGPAGLDVSPRGDPAPLVRVLDETTMLLPERRGVAAISPLDTAAGAGVGAHGRRDTGCADAGRSRWVCLRSRAARATAFDAVLSTAPMASRPSLDPARSRTARWPGD